METTSERIKKGMALRNMKQSDLVEKTKISKGALSSYITGRYTPKQNNIYLIAKALDVSETWLMGYDVSMERNPEIDSNQVFLKYLTSLGYRISQDDPEHKPSMSPRTVGVPCRLKYDTLDSLKLRIDSYAKATIDAELLSLQEEEIREKRKEKESLIRHLSGENIYDGSQFEKDWNATHLMPSAAHERTDIEVTDEMRKHDDDIMDDPDF